MSHGLKKNRLKKSVSEEEIDRWLKGVNLSNLSSKFKFQRSHFPNLRPTNWDKLYQKFQKSRPISIRLPGQILDKLKQVSLSKGIGYQSLIRVWITEKLQGS